MLRSALCNLHQDDEAMVGIGSSPLQIGCDVGTVTNSALLINHAGKYYGSTVTFCNT